MLKKCDYCGNNPVPHWMYWYMESLNIWFTPLRQKLLYNPLTVWLKRQQFDNYFGKIFLRLGLGLKIFRWQTDIKKCKIRRAQVLWEEAGKRGMEMKELLLLGKPIDVYEAAKLDVNRKLLIVNRFIFSGLPRPAGYINPWLDLMDDKWLFKKLMIENGLPVAIGKSCWNFSQAKEIFQKIHKKSENERRIGESENRRIGFLSSDISDYPTFRLPTSVIVKPRSGSRGRHSTTFVSSVEDLKKAFKIAKKLCFWVMVEEQLAGPVYRATVVNFELCGVLRGDPPQVVGDGISSIAELISDKNQKFHAGVKDVVVDDQIKLFLSRQHLSLSSVPQKDLMINLSEKIGVNYGGSSSEDFDICHSDNKELFVKAAKVLGDPIVGFDFIIPDISKSWKEQKCGFIEVNSLPFINLHHDPLHGTPKNVAAKVWDMVGM